MNRWDYAYYDEQLERYATGDDLAYFSMPKYTKRRRVPEHRMKKVRVWQEARVEWSKKS